MKKLFLSLIFSLSIFALSAQEKTFQFSGKPIVTIFANVHTGLGNANGNAGFDLDRSYLGYQFSVTKQLSGKVVFDIGPSKVAGSDLERIAYVKNAMLTWKTGDFSLDFGLITLEQFNIQEKFWGYRYIRKSFQDEYKFNSSADMGVIGKYKFTDWLSADVTFINGEGYKKINKDNNFRYGAGVTAKPLKNVTLRAYWDMYNGDGEESKDQHSMALFAGYKHKCFSIGGEYNKLFNTKFTENQDQSGYSVYGTVNVSEKFALFGRYDNLSSRNHYSGADQQFGLAGLQYTPNKYLRLSPNYQVVKPQNGKAESYLFLSLGFFI